VSFSKEDFFHIVSDIFSFHLRIFWVQCASQICCMYLSDLLHIQPNGSNFHGQNLIQIGVVSTKIILGILIIMFLVRRNELSLNQ